MPLSTLPREIIHHIFAALLRAIPIGPRKIHHLRVVNKLFNSAILNALIISSLNPPNSIFHTWLSKWIIPFSNKGWTNQTHHRISPPIFRHFIAAQIQSGVSSPAISHLRTVLESLDSLFPISDQEERQNRTLNICEGAAEYLEYSNDNKHEIVLAWHFPFPLPPQPLPTIEEEAQSLLSTAIITGNILLVKSLQDKTTDLNLNHESPYFGLPLQIAAYWNHLDILELLLAHDANPLATQFHEASCNPIDYFTNKTRGIYYSTHGTPLQVASLRGHISIVNLLLQVPNKLPTSEALPSLYAAVRGGHVKVLEILLEAYPDFEDRETMLGNLFLQGCRWGRAEVVERMLALGVPKGTSRRNVCAEERSWNGVEFATLRGDERILKLLTEA